VSTTGAGPRAGSGQGPPGPSRPRTARPGAPGPRPRTEAKSPATALPVLRPSPVRADLDGLFGAVRARHPAPVQGLDSARAVAKPVGHIEGTGLVVDPQLRHGTACLLWICQLTRDMELDAQIPQVLRRVLELQHLGDPQAPHGRKGANLPPHGPDPVRSHLENPRRSARRETQAKHVSVIGGDPVNAVHVRVQSPGNIPRTGLVGCSRSRGAH